jgi:SAM-dependent methyltransferase
VRAFEELVAEAESQSFEGWNFSYLDGRLTEGPLPWDYTRIVTGLLPGVDSFLDLGTGGGELLASLRPLPRFTLATEGYRPNVPVAKRRLHPLGVQVIETFCDDNNNLVPQRGALPFRDDSMDLVIDRHESFIAVEISRILKPSGRFITQQVGGADHPDELKAALGVAEAPSPTTMMTRWDLKEAVRQIEDAGLVVTDAREAGLDAWFSDIGAVVYFLRAVPWRIPGFSVEKYRSGLSELDRTIRQDGKFRVNFSRFLVQATKQC